MSEPMTVEDYRDIFEQSDPWWMTDMSMVRIGRVFDGQATEAVVRDVHDFDECGTFTLDKLRNAWAKLATKAGYFDPAYYYHETGEHDVITYSEAVQLAVFGEVVYG